MTRSGRWLIGIVTALALGTAAGCGAAGNDATGHDARARLGAALLTAADLGSGWATKPEPWVPRSGGACGLAVATRPPAGLVMRALDKPGPSGFTLVVLAARAYASPAAARQSFELQRARVRNCTSERVNGVSWTVSSLTRPTVGDASFASAATTDLSGVGLTTAHTTALLGDLVVTISVGYGGDQPDDRSFDQMVAHRQVARLRPVAHG